MPSLTFALGFPAAKERAPMRIAFLGTLGFLSMMFFGGCNALHRETATLRSNGAATGNAGEVPPSNTNRLSSNPTSSTSEIVRIRLIDPDAQPADSATNEEGKTGDPEKIASNPDHPLPADPSVVQMDALRVSGKTYLSFDFSMSFVRNGERISWATITSVKPNSEASAVGLTPLTRVLAINGKDIEEYEASFRYGSELNALLINRKPGSKITLEVLLDGYSQRRTVTLVKRMANLRLDPDDILRGP